MEINLFRNREQRPNALHCIHIYYKRPYVVQGTLAIFAKVARSKRVIACECSKFPEKRLNQLSRMSARRFLVPAPSGALAFDTVIFSRSHDLFASSRSCYSSFDFTHVVYRLHRVAALKIMYFRGGVGRTFFLRSPRVSFRRLPPSLRRFSFLSRSSLSHPVLLPPPESPGVTMAAL